MSTIDFGFPGHFGKIYDMNLYTGTIVSVAGNIASVNIKGTVYDNVEICYNCEDGSSVNGGSAFLPGDEVYILNKGGKTPLWVPNLIIVGFTNGKHACEEVFYIKLTRGDGTIIDSSLLNYIFVYTSAKSWVNREVTYITNPSDPKYQYWKIKIISPIDVNGYYIRYDAEESITTQYPYRYKSADWFNSIDLIKPGVYEDTVPYWVVTTESTMTGQLLYAASDYKKLTIKSSVPYRVIKQAYRGSSVYSMFFSANGGGLPGLQGYQCCTAGVGNCQNGPIGDCSDMGLANPETCGLTHTGTSCGTTFRIYDETGDLNLTSTNKGGAIPFEGAVVSTDINTPSISGIEHSITITNLSDSSITWICENQSTSEPTCSTFTCTPLLYTKYFPSSIKMSYELL